MIKNPHQDHQYPPLRKILFAKSHFQTLSLGKLFEEYAFYGGMPLILSRPTEMAKINYLKALITEVYIKDIVERKKIEYPNVLEQLDRTLT